MHVRSMFTDSKMLIQDAQPRKRKKQGLQFLLTIAYVTKIILD